MNQLRFQRRPVNIVPGPQCTNEGPIIMWVDEHGVLAVNTLYLRRPTITHVPSGKMLCGTAPGGATLAEAKRLVTVLHDRIGTETLRNLTDRPPADIAARVKSAVNTLWLDR